MARVLFGKAMRKGYIKSRESAQEMTKEYAERFKADWESRFGNDDKVAGPSGVPGTAEPLRQSTINARIARGYYQTGMLLDPSLPHVDEEGEGTIQGSITMTPEQNRRRGFYDEVWYSVYTAHSKFPLNEFGIGVPQRMTLRPTELAIGPDFTKDFTKEQENILRSREHLT